eukprot:18002-Heterococcus_DN1.PRE.2
MLLVGVNGKAVRHQQHLCGPGSQRAEMAIELFSVSSHGGAKGADSKRAVTAATGSAVAQR